MLKPKTIWVISIICLAVLLKLNTDFVFAQLNVQKTEAKVEKISLDLKAADILDILRTLATKSGFTINTSKNVSGRVTIFLNNLTVEEALEVILVNQNLAYEKKGNIVTVMTAAEYQELFGKKFVEKRKVFTVKAQYAKPESIADVLNELKSDIGKIIIDSASGTIMIIDIPEKIELMSDVIKQLDQPLATEVFEFDYAKANTLKPYIESLLTPKVGSIIIDDRTNKAVVSDLPERINKIRNVVKAFDDTSRQVLIKGEIVQVALDDKFESGIQWEKIFSWKKIHNLDNVAEFPISTEVTANQKINVGTLEENDFNAVLKFVQEYGHTRIISQPQIVAMNNQEATVSISTREAYVTRTTSQAAETLVTAESVQFIDVGIKLSVTPSIGKDGFITMKIKPEISSVVDTLPTASTEVPIVETSMAETVAKVKDGTMLMIAGIIKEEKSDSRQGWPILSRIPGLDLLFAKRTRHAPKRSELIIFLTPRLITGDVATNKATIAVVDQNLVIPQDKAEFENNKAVFVDFTEKIKGIKH